MPQYIVYREGAYNVFSTISDTFGFEPALTRTELEEWYQFQYGQRGMEELPQRIERAHATGSSGAPPFDGLDWMIESNRQGESEKALSEKECVRRFLTLPVMS